MRIRPRPIDRSATSGPLQLSGHAGPSRLDPVGRLRLPRRVTLLRAGLVAVLLLTAAGVLHAGPTDTDEPRSAGSSTGPPSPDRSSPTVPPAGHPPPAEAAAVDPPPPLPTGRPLNGDDPARLPIPAGLVAVPVPLTDPASLAMLRPGDRVDLLALPAGRPAAPVAADVLVLAVDHAVAALLLALTRDQGETVLTLAGGRFGVILRG